MQEKTRTHTIWFNNGYEDILSNSGATSTENTILGEQRRNITKNKNKR